MVMKNIININEYNDLINESNIIRNEIEEIDKDIISSNNGIKTAGKNINGALIAAGASIATCIVTLALKTPILVSFISGGMAAVSFNWALTATSYINIEKNRENNFNLTEISKNTAFNVKTKAGVKVKKRSINDNK